MSKSAVLFTCGHAHPEVSNERFKWLGNYIYDAKPDFVFDLGDGADMPSLSVYDERYPKVHSSKSYEKDIVCYNEAQELLRHKFKEQRRKKPYWVGFEGNHENRIKKAIAHDPRLEGNKHGLSFKHLNTSTWFNEYHEYHNGGPAIGTYCGVDFAHFFTSGNSSYAIGGINHAHSLIQKRHRSSVCGHSHKRDVKFDDSVPPKGLIALVAGCFKGAEETWAGQSNAGWWKGVVHLSDLDNGMFTPTFISLNQLRKIYG